MYYTYNLVRLYNYQKICSVTLINLPRQPHGDDESWRHGHESLVLRRRQTFQTCEIIYYRVIILNWMIFIFKNFYSAWPSWGECYVCNLCTPLNDVCQLLHSFTPRRVSNRWLNHTLRLHGFPHRVTWERDSEENRRRLCTWCLSCWFMVFALAGGPCGQIWSQ